MDEVLEFIVILQVGEVPEQPPDQPAKAEFPSGVAVRVTTVAAVNVLPGGFAVTVPFPFPALATVREYREIADWLTVRVLPATITVPVLEVPFGLVETEYPTVPFPLPLLPDRIETQPTLLEELQEQPLAAATVTLPAPPPALNDWLAGAIE